MTRAVPAWHSDDHDAKIPDRVKLRIFLRADGRCQKCTRKIGAKDQWACDHVVALVNEGLHSEDNMQALCIDCHKGKTRSDVALKAKTDRIRKRNAGIRKPRTIRAWRRFDGSPVYETRER